ncbi:MAG TPA: class I SAM-dependent methyltransferase [Caulobacteraceae bacterium]|nr:class I SAM-dependent methyltransferase [Caulobacteraceae bacterium]
MEPQTPVREGYDRWAPTYDAQPNRTRDAAFARFRAWTPHFAGGRALELGCGTGLNTEHLAAHAASATALDFSDGMLAQAERRLAGRGVGFLRHDLAQPLPFPDGAFDCVVETLVLEHLPELASLFAEVRRVLAPEGRFLLSELHPYRQLLGKQARIDTGDGAPVLVQAYARRVSDFVNAALEAGFELLSLDEDQDPSGEPRLLSLALRRR